MMTTETIADDSLQARLARLRDLALANGVKLVSEAELKIVRQRRIERRRKVLPPIRRATEVTAQDFRSSCPPEREWNAVESPSHAPADLEQEFQAAGAADSANALFTAWFRRRENFNRPFLKKFLEETVMQGKSGCVNNRAKDCRAEFITAGLYIDNDSTGAVWSEKFGWNLPRGSYYRLCRIEDATSLPDAQKQIRPRRAPTEKRTVGMDDRDVRQGRERVMWNGEPSQPASTT